MTRRGYILLAGVLVRVVPIDLRERLVRELVPILKTDNRHFQADKFANACGTTADYGY